MRFFLMLLFVLGSVSAIANEYTVTVPIDSANTDEIKQVARVKAQWAAALDLPVVVGGQAHLSASGDYSEEIKALALAAMDVHTLSEKWDHESGLYTLKARVVLDESKTASLLTEITNNKELGAQLSSLHDAVIRVIESSRMNDELRQFDSALNATQAFILLMDEKARKKAEGQLKLLYHQTTIDYLVTPIMSAFEYHVESKSDGEMRIRVANPRLGERWTMDLGWSKLGTCATLAGLSWRERRSKPHAAFRTSTDRGRKLFVEPVGCVFAEVFRGTKYEAEPLAFTLRFKDHHYVSHIKNKMDGLVYHISIRYPSEALRNATTNAEFTKELFVAKLKW